MEGALKIAWLFNLDADRELERPLGYNPQAKDLARLEAMVERIADLALEGDRRLLESEALGGGFLGRAWCPTPRAARLLARAGVELDAAPPFEVVRRVNHRGFCASLGQPLEGACFVTDLDGVREILARKNDGGMWLMKRPYSFAGTGRRRIRGGALSRDDEAWVRASLRHDGLQIEPWVERTGDFCVHGHVDRAGVVVLGEPCVQHCSDSGAWLSTRRAREDELEAEERAASMAEAATVAAALGRAGYFGPFGIDAYRYRGPQGLCFNARSEINARYTMGWAVGMGSSRPDRVRRKERSA